MGSEEGTFISISSSSLSRPGCDGDEDSTAADGEALPDEGNTVDGEAVSDVSMSKGTADGSIVCTVLSALKLDGEALSDEGNTVT